MKQKPLSEPTTIDEYIAGHPPKVQAILRKIRKVMRQAAPRAGEAIKYRIPTFTLHGNLIFFAAFENHVSVYPRTPGMAKFDRAIAPYASGRGTLKFALDEPIPYGLIGKLTKVRVEEAMAAAVAPRAGKKKAAKKKAAATTKTRTRTATSTRTR
jgi:uncharacterized protein YdhG (YjbR/CyaY superfamily)